MIIPLEKLLMYSGNKYEFTRGTMASFEKIGNIREYPEDDISWKVVPNILKLSLEGYFKYEKKTPQEIDEATEE